MTAPPKSRQINALKNVNGVDDDIDRRAAIGLARVLPHTMENSFKKAFTSPASPSPPGALGCRCDKMSVDVLDWIVQSIGSQIPQ
jgi:hypothetical protein